MQTRWHPATPSWSEASGVIKTMQRSNFVDLKLSDLTTVTPLASGGE